MSPVTTMVADEMKKSSSTTLEQAKKAVSQRLGTSFDPVDDYIAAAKDGTDASAQQNAQRLHRIAQVTTRVMAQIENNVNQTDLDQAGITKAEFLARSARQIELLVSVIIDDVDATLSDPDFDADTVVDSPNYAVTPPIEDPTTSDPQPNEPPTDVVDPDPSGPVLADRLVEATSAGPFFMGSTTGLRPQEGAAATYLEIQESETLPDRYYYFTLDRMLETGSGSTGTLTQRETASKTVAGEVVPEPISSDLADLKVFEDSEHTLMTVYESFLGSINVTATDGDLAGTSFEGAIEINSSYMEVDLAGA